MIVISDAAPLRYLILIDQAHLLGVIYGHVIVPRAVISELQHERTPAKTRAWVTNPPEWLEMRVVFDPDPTLHLGAGEREALTLASQIPEALLLIDERKATKIAQAKGFLVTGTLGILMEGAKRGLANLQEAIDRLQRETNFRGSPQLYAFILQQDRD